MSGRITPRHFLPPDPEAIFELERAQGTPRVCRSSHPFYRWERQAGKEQGLATDNLEAGLWGSGLALYHDATRPLRVTGAEGGPWHDQRSEVRADMGRPPRACGRGPVIDQLVPWAHPRQRLRLSQARFCPLRVSPAFGAVITLSLRGKLITQLFYFCPQPAPLAEVISFPTRAMGGKQMSRIQGIHRSPHRDPGASVRPWKKGQLGHWGPEGFFSFSSFCWLRSFGQV